MTESERAETSLWIKERRIECLAGLATVLPPYFEVSARMHKLLRERMGETNDLLGNEAYEDNGEPMVFRGIPVVITEQAASA